MKNKVKNQKNVTVPVNKTDKTLALILWSLWCVLLVAGAITLFDPYWLLDITKDNRKHDSEKYINTAKNLCQNQQYDAAIWCLKQALNKYPDMPEALTNIGVIYKNAGNYDNAIAFLVKALKSDSTCKKNIYYNLTDIYSVKKNYSKAEYYSDLALTCDFTLFNRYFKKSVLLMNGNYWNNAEYYLRKIDTAYSDINSQIIDLVGRVKENTKRNALICYSIDFENWKKNPKLLQSNYDLNLLLKLNSKSAFLSKVYNKIGFCLAKENNFAEAKQYFIKSQNCDITNQDARANFKYVSDILNNRNN